MLLLVTLLRDTARQMQNIQVFGGLEKNTTDKKLRRRQRNAFALLQAVLSYHPCFLAQRMTIPTALVRIKIQRMARKKSV